MSHDAPAYGLWMLVILNSAVFILFAFFARPQTRRDWRSLGAFSAFIVALFTEMYGFPLTTAAWRPGTPRNAALWCCSTRSKPYGPGTPERPEKNQRVPQRAVQAGPEHVGEPQHVICIERRLQKLPNHVQEQSSAHQTNLRDVPEVVQPGSPAVGL